MKFAQFGAKPTKQDLEKYAQSPHWKEDVFQNLTSTTMGVKWTKIPYLIQKQFIEKNDKIPKENLDILPFNSQNFSSKSTMQAIWYGHSVLFLKMEGLNILIDPMFGQNAAPISPIAVPRFSKNTLSIIDTLPDLDLVLISHDHYDHLDYDSILKLKKKTKHFYVAIGVKRHLTKWGIPSEKITEFDWWETASFKNLKITFTPSRHFAGRGLRDRMKSFWGGWVITSSSEKIWFSGDSGYGKHFADIGKHFGSFDFAFMECGQYSPLWPNIHMLPKESVQAAKDANAKRIMPVHWGGFSLAQHDWQEPVEQFITEAQRQEIPYSVPRLGEVFGIHKTENNRWWRDKKK